MVIFYDFGLVLDNGVLGFIQKNCIIYEIVYVAHNMQTKSPIFDTELVVLGGGSSGTAIARDASGRGIQTVLFEARDLGSATSSASSKLIHGGLRYLSNYEFKMVGKALAEREKLIHAAPHLIRPMGFTVPFDPVLQEPPEDTGFWGRIKHKLQTSWLGLRLGMLLYDRLDLLYRDWSKPRIMPLSCPINLKAEFQGAVLNERYEKGFVYSDARGDDTRLVVANAMAAQENGADIRTQTEITRLEEIEGGWRVYFKDAQTGAEDSMTTRTLVNAAGPWVRKVLDQSDLADEEKTPSIRGVKGSHIVLGPEFADMCKDDNAYTIMYPNNRVFFVTPHYESGGVMIGTTEEKFDGSPYDAEMSDEELAYLIKHFNKAFKRQISEDDILWSWSGVRPIVEDPTADDSSASRDYKVLHHDEFKSPLISVFGGKLTAFREIGEEVTDKLEEHAAAQFKNLKSGAWTSYKPLPGGDIKDADFGAFLAEQRGKYDWLPDVLLERLARSYGTNIQKVLGNAHSVEDLGHNYGEGEDHAIYECEVKYLLRAEFAKSAEDILYRRSKMHLHVPAAEIQKLAQDIPAFLSDLSR